MGVIAKYKFNNTLEANLLPEFNIEFTSDLYTVTDEVNGEVTTRTIESDSLPTLMRFGRVWVSGEFTANNRTDSLLEVLDMNASGLTSCHSMFRYNTNLTSISCEWDTSNVTEMSNMFAYCTNLTSLDVSNWDTSKVTSMYGTFSSCTNLTSLDVSNFNTNKVTTMHYTFYGCNNLTSLDLSNFDTSEVTSMQGMFTYCFKLTSLDVSNFNTSNVTTMYSMFYGCKSLTSLDVSNWDTNNVTTMNGMFYGCNNLTTLDVSNWNTSNVTDMYQMFRDCSSLVSLDVSRFDTSKVTTMYCMFYNCRNLAELDVSNWNTSNVESMYSMFCNCIRLLSLDISKWDTSKNVSMDYMFSGYNYDMNLVSLDINNFNIDNINRDYSHLFERMPHLKYLKCKNTNVLNILLPYLPTRTSDNQGTIICKSDITNLDTTVLQSKNWNILDEPTLIAKYVFDKSIYNNCIPEFNTEFEGYFIEDEVEEGSNEVTRTIESCGMLPTLMRFGMESNNNLITNSLLKILDMNTSQITNMHYMFRACINLISIKCNWNTSKVTTMNNTFCNCNKLIYLDTFNWDTSNVTDMNGIFFGCNALEKIDISNWDTSKVTRLNYAFANRAKIINLSNCNCEKVIDFGYAFAYNEKIILLNISGLNISNTSAITDMFVTTPNLKNIIMLNCNLSTIQKVASLLPTTHTQTIWHNLSKADEELYQTVKGVELKRYEKNEVEVRLNSPLLEGDRIEVKDGRLCHYHKMGMVVLDGSENWTTWINSTNPDGFSSYYIYYDTTLAQYALGVPRGKSRVPVCDKLIGNKMSGHASRYVGINSINGYLTITLPHIELGIDNNTTIDNRLSSFKQWLQANPTTVIYELETPYYEDITNLQSVPTLKTYLECSMEIDTNLPIDANVTYRTNLSSVYVMERELDELDNGTDLGDILEGEVNE